jgi:hypothetical protein
MNTRSNQTNDQQTDARLVRRWAGPDCLVPRASGSKGGQ